MFDECKEPPSDVFIVFLIPQPAQIALGVFELVQNLDVEIAVSGGDGTCLLGAQEITQPIDQDATQPTTEFALLGIVMKVRHLTDHDFENLLHQIVGILWTDGVSAQPRLKQGPVERVEALPGFGIFGMFTETLQ